MWPDNEDRWINALDIAEHSRDLTQLAELLSGDLEMPVSVRLHLSTLMKNGTLIVRLRKGNDLDRRLNIAAFEFKTFRHSGETRDERIERCAVANDVTEAR